jgi:hypothetical protein
LQQTAHKCHVKRENGETEEETVGRQRHYLDRVETTLTNFLKRERRMQKEHLLSSRATMLTGDGIAAAFTTYTSPLKSEKGETEVTSVVRWHNNLDGLQQPWTLTNVL